MMVTGGGLPLKKSILWRRIAILTLFMLPGWNNSGYANSDCNLAKAIFSKSQYSFSEERERIPHYRKAVELCPGYIRPYELLGNWHRKNGDKKTAINWFEKAAALGSNNSKLYYLLAKLLIDMGRTDEAWQSINKSLELRGSYSRAIKLKAKIEQIVDSEGPKIVLFEPAARRGVQIIKKYENVTVRGRVYDKSGVEWLKINNVPVVVEKKGHFYRNIPLDESEREVRIVSADAIGNITEIVFTAVRRKSFIQDFASDTPTLSDLSSLYNKSYAVIIGINQYEKWPQLEFAVADAIAVKKIAADSGFDEVITVYDEKATQRKILSILYQELPQKVNENDRLFFYFAGHGQTYQTENGDKQGYIIPVDSDLHDFQTAGISMDQIRSLSNRINARHILYVMDSCYSGLGFSRSGGLSQSLSNYLNKVARLRVVQMITAGGSGEQVQERGGHGLFTAYFMKGLYGSADRNRDGFVTGTELGAFLRPSVSDASNNAQTPLFGRFEGEGEFLFPVLNQ